MQSIRHPLTNHWYALFLSGLVLCTACQSLRAPAPQPAMSAAAETRNNALSLLFALLDDERNVSKLLIIKRDRRELHEVIKNISTTADSVHKQLAKMANEDATLNLKASALPPGEKATRDSE